ncbi:MAG: hypothetical protein S4CHLAM102_00900 [Chlamydiia bacterium]|nr:hypothetical protein [Chlamydiia bacterium]
MAAAHFVSAPADNSCINFDCDCCTCDNPELTFAKVMVVAITVLCLSPFLAVEPISTLALMVVISVSLIALMECASNCDPEPYTGARFTPAPVAIPTTGFLAAAPLHHTSSTVIINQGSPGPAHQGGATVSTRPPTGQLSGSSNERAVVGSAADKRPASQPRAPYAPGAAATTAAAHVVYSKHAAAKAPSQTGLSMRPSMAGRGQLAAAPGARPTGSLGGSMMTTIGGASLRPTGTGDLAGRAQVGSATRQQRPGEGTGMFGSPKR